MLAESIPIGGWCFCGGRRQALVVSPPVALPLVEWPLVASRQVARFVRAVLADPLYGMRNRTIVSICFRFKLDRPPKLNRSFWRRPMTSA